MSSDNHGSFLNGFAIGLFAGAAGYFLFGTKKGSSFRSKLATEWENAKGELEKDGVIEQGKNIREIVTEVVSKMSESSKPKSGKSKAKSKAAKNKFKGT